MWNWLRKKPNEDVVEQKFEEVTTKLKKTNVELEIEIRRTKKLVIGFDFGDK